MSNVDHEQGVRDAGRNQNPKPNASPAYQAGYNSNKK